ncbi:MAG: hypothetical protein ACI310_00800 [Bacilli bacterium]
MNVVVNKKILNLDETSKNKLNARIIIALFKNMYNQNKITKKEYDSLISSVNRTFNLNK